jgi:hypothetical protein
VRGAVQVVAGLAAGPALALAALDGDRLWVALLATGLGLAVVATTPQRHQLGWGAGLVLAASSWVRLADADVDAPEAYTVPAGVALLVVGALRRRRDPAYGSWAAYGSGLSLILVPSLLRAVTDSGDLRPLLLAVVAAAVLAAGVARRLQAPLVLGAAVLGDRRPGAAGSLPRRGLRRGAALGDDRGARAGPAGGPGPPTSSGFVTCSGSADGWPDLAEARNARRGSMLCVTMCLRCRYDARATRRGRPGDLRAARARLAP